MGGLLGGGGGAKGYVGPSSQIIGGGAAPPPLPTPMKTFLKLLIQHGSKFVGVGLEGRGKQSDS